MQLNGKSLMLLIMECLKKENSNYYIVQVLKNTPAYQKIRDKRIENILSTEGLISNKFNCFKEFLKIKEGRLEESLEYQIKKKFNKLKRSPFKDTGFMSDSIFFTSVTKPKSSKLKVNIKDILEDDINVKKEFTFKIKKLDRELKIKFSNGKKTTLKTNLDKLKFYKSSKEIIKKNKKGFEYKYKEGEIRFPDPLDKPGRTIITSSGSTSTSRSLHIIKDEGVYRMLTPIEFERLNMFPKDHTKIDGISNYKRVFLMGNALVIGIVELLGDSLADIVIEKS